MSKQFPFPGRDEALDILRADAAYRKLSPQDVETVLQRAWHAGATAGEKFLALHRGEDPVSFAQVFQQASFSIYEKDADNVVGTTRYFAIIEPERKTVTLFKKAIEQWAEHWSLSYESACDLILMHEYFHYLESSELGYTSKLYEVPLMSVLGMKIGKTGIRAMSEIAANEFAHTVFTARTADSQARGENKKMKVNPDFGVPFAPEKLYVYPGPQGKYVRMRQFSNVILNRVFGADPLRQGLDVVLPGTVEEGPYPCILYIYGGGWRRGTRRSPSGRNVYQFVQKGVAVAAIGYHLSSEGHHFPEQINDVKAGIRYLVAHAEELGIDPERLVVYGESSGAHLAQLVAATYHTHECENLLMGNEDTTFVIRGLVSFFGLSDFTRMDEGFAEVNGEGPFETGDGMDVAHCKLMGYPVNRNPEAARRAGSLHYVSEHFPPALLFHGKNDHLVPANQSILLKEKVDSVCGSERCELVLIDGADHGTEEFFTLEVMNRIWMFLAGLFWPGKEMEPLDALTPISVTDEWEE